MKEAQPSVAPQSARTPSLVRVYHANRSEGSFIHGEHKLVPGGFADVPEDVAAIWLDHRQSIKGGLPLVVSRSEEITPRVVELANENEKLKAEAAEFEKLAESFEKSANERLAASEKSANDRIAALEKLVADLKAAGSVSIPVASEAKPNETGQTVVTGEALKTAKADPKVAQAKKG